jgi:Protein of unknown function (DUF1585)
MIIWVGDASRSFDLHPHPCHGSEKQKGDRRFDQLSHPAANDRLLTYACGRRIDTLDEAIVEKIVAGMQESKHGLRSLIEAVVISELFLSR